MYLILLRYSAKRMSKGIWSRIVLNCFMLRVSNTEQKVEEYEGDESGKQKK